MVDVPYITIASILVLVLRHVLLCFIVRVVNDKDSAATMPMRHSWQV